MRAGFTLIEVLVAATLLTLGLGTAAYLMASAYGTFRAQERTIESQHLVHNALETMVSTSYAELMSDLASARNPGEPAREALVPLRDYVKEGDGSVKATVELVPPGPDETKYKVQRKDPTKGLFLTLSRQPRTTIEMTVRLQHWDPVLDRPSATAAGLVRATCQTNVHGTRDGGAVYVAR